MSKVQISKNFIKKTCKLALAEDLYPSGDITSSLLDNNIKKKLKIIANQNTIVGGLEFAKHTFKLIDSMFFILISLVEFCNFLMRF